MSNPIQDLLKLKGDILAYHAIVKGDFDKEIARLEELMKAAGEKLGLVQTIHDATERAAVIEHEANKTLADARIILDRAEGRAKGIEIQNKELQIRENVVRQCELDTHADRTALLQEQDIHQKHVTTLTQDLHEKQVAVDKSAADLAQLREELEARAARLKAAVQVV